RWCRGRARVLRGLRTSDAAPPLGRRRGRRLKPAVLIACASDWASPARLPLVLKKAGARVSALCAPGRPLAATRYVDERIAAPLELDEFVVALEHELARVAYDWVLVADDPLLSALAARRRERWLDGVLPIAGEHRAAAALASKAAF